jgi:hypothetical protein
MVDIWSIGMAVAVRRYIFRRTAPDSLKVYVGSSRRLLYPPFLSEFSDSAGIRRFLRLTILGYRNGLRPRVSVPCPERRLTTGEKLTGDLHQSKIETGNNETVSQCKSHISQCKVIKSQAAAFLVLVVFGSLSRALPEPRGSSILGSRETCAAQVELKSHLLALKGV